MSNEKPGEDRSIDVSILRDKTIASAGGTRSFSDARKAGACVLCGKTPLGPFTDAVSERESTISQTCQGCQDRLFAEPEDECQDPDGLIEPLPPPPMRCDARCPHFKAKTPLPGGNQNMCTHPKALVVFSYTGAPVPSWCPKVHEDGDGDRERALARTCKACGDRYMPPKQAYMDEWKHHEDWCHLCAHFMRQRDKPATVAQVGEHRMLYGIGEEPSENERYRSHLGHGGARFRFRRLDGTSFESTNVWSSGAISPVLWPHFPINATLEVVR